MMDSCKPPLGTRMKPRAPPPPQAPQPAPRRLIRNAESLDGMTDRDAKENMLSARVELDLTLPSGAHTSVTEDGSTALMDVLVELCSRYHLNPSVHTLELFTPEGHPLGFKPNALLGSLDVARVLIKEKVLEERVVRRPAPRVPEKTVRLLVNYHGSQKAVVRVNPLLPLQDLVPVVCDKCELDPALIVLLKDNTSRQELPLDKSLSHLGIKELYVHDKSLDSIRSSTNSLARAEKKGLLGIFQFSRRKSKTETSSLDMEDYDDRNSQNTDAESHAMSSLFGSPYVDERPQVLVQSQSAVNISRMSPKAENKKRRAPAPPAGATSSTEHPDFDSNQMSLGSESQQRKRKAPAPPPTPVSMCSGSDDMSAAVTPVILHVPVSVPVPEPVPVPAPAPMPRAAAVMTSTVIDDPKPAAPLPPPASERSTSMEQRSSTPSSSTSGSLAVQDSSSELSQSLADSDAGSVCSSDTGSTVSRPTHAQSTAESYVSRTEQSETTNLWASDASTAGSSRSDTESALDLKVEETENNRHSAVESLERPVPPKPRRSAARESLSRSVSTDSNPKAVQGDEGPHSWLHSEPRSGPPGHGPEACVDETVSLGSDSSSSSSSRDQGYAASEGTADGEDSGLVSSPSETHTTSPDGSLSLDGSAAGERRVGAVADSDSDEGSWGPRHRSRDVTPLSSTDRLQHQDLSAQLHRTLADLESNLRDTDEVPVSILDHDVPVTTIDEVLPDEGFWAEAVTTTASNFSDELQNRNNNAHTAAESTGNKPLSKHKHKDKSKTHPKKDPAVEPKTKEIKKTKPSSEAKCNSEEQKIVPKPEPEKILREEKPTRQDDPPKAHHSFSAPKPLQSKITANVTSRFGMKTFTVVPPKPAIAQAAAAEERASVSPGAIKIDEQGNMVKAWHRRPTEASHEKNGHDSPLLGKAKAFWSSSEKQEGLADKERDSLDCHKSAWTKTEAEQRSVDVMNLKTSQGALHKSPQTEPKETAEDTAQHEKDSTAKQKDDDRIPVGFKSNPKPAPPPFIGDVRRDLSFLKPSRRTSSQYVASAITKHAPKTVFKPDVNPDYLFPKSGKSIQIHPQGSFRSCNADAAVPRIERVSGREDESADRTKNGPQESQLSGFGKGIFTTQEAKTSAPSAAQLTVTVGDTFRPVHRRSPSPSPSRAPHSSDKPAPALKNGLREQRAATNTITSLSSNPRAPEEKPSNTDSAPALCPVPCPAPSPPAVTVFGPVKKFKPVISRSVEKETSLHSSLMEAIQSGGGKERLKKISTSGAHVKKPSYVEEENERSALMAAIRAQGSSGRLRKTNCEAAEELETFRKSAVAVNVSSSSASSSSPRLQSSVPPPPPSSSGAPPPPLPPVLPALKSFSLPRPNTSPNPASAREAMLEAIRSGSAAEKLKKVAAPTKTVQVNGRLGTMKTTPSTLS